MERKTVLESKFVEEFVGVAHTDLDRTKVLLAQEPGLINATWDWGGGDLETPLVLPNMWTEQISTISNRLLVNVLTSSLFFCPIFLSILIE